VAAIKRFAPAEDPPAGAPAWVLPYGDMMSLLLACFLMLLSMSEIKQDHRFRAMADSLRQQFSDETTTAGWLSGSASRRESSGLPIAGIGRARREQAIDNQSAVRLSHSPAAN
jgi:chemotaxis protein MotB